MRHLFRTRPATTQDVDEWQQEMALWGMDDELDTDEPDYELWEEHAEIIDWWLGIPDFLRFNHRVCLGMNVVAVKADAELSDRHVTPEHYHALKLIAKTAVEELNRELQ